MEEVSFISFCCLHENASPKFYLCPALSAVKSIIIDKVKFIKKLKISRGIALWAVKFINLRLD